jgi:hypothetical protein
MTTRPDRESQTHVERPDPLLEEVRRLKRESWERAGRDLDQLVKELQEIERQHADRLVFPPPDSTGSP